jgi:hypothetical protein
MSDERKTDGMQPGGFDDDRLLACALGLDDDPELLAAAEADAALAARLAAMRGDVAAVGAHVSAAVPSPPADYADLAGERWSGLQEYFAPPAGAAPARRARRWLRVAAPVTALVVLALVVGIVAVDRGSNSSGGPSSSAELSSAGSHGATDTGAGGQAPVKALTATQRFADQLDQFAVVVLARAREASGSFQRFAVLRIFKGDAPGLVRLEVDGHPTDPGRLHLLMLEPVASSAGQVGSPAPYAAPSTVAGRAGGPGTMLNVAYTYNGAPTVVRELAAGTDPALVTVPIP